MNFDIISVWLSDVVKYVDIIVGGNEFAAGAILAGLMAGGTYVLSSYPLRLRAFIIKHSTTTLEVNNTCSSYYNLQTYLNKHNIIQSSRFINITNGMYDSSTGSVKELGYGTQLFWLNRWPVIVTIWKEDSQSSNIKEFIKIVKIGRSHQLFDDLLLELNEQNIDNTVTKFYNVDSDGYSRFITSQTKRRMDTVILKQESKDKLCAAIDAFRNKEEWYIKHQIPYQLGILLYGPPGTGKTSLIRAIATYMDLDICYVTSDMALAAAAQKTKGSIIVAEEADTLSLAARDNNDDDDETASNDDVTTKKDTPLPVKSSFGDAWDDMSKNQLGKVLNALDGIISNHGRIIILTTNYIDKLDSALLRPGRIDLQLEIGYVCSEVFNGLLAKFYPGETVPKDYIIKEKVSPADIQNDIILSKTVAELIDKYTVVSSENINNNILKVSLSSKKRLTNSTSNV